MANGATDVCCDDYFERVQSSLKKYSTDKKDKIDSMWFLVFVTIAVGVYWWWMRKNCGCSSPESIDDIVVVEEKSGDAVESFANATASLPRVSYFEPSETLLVLEDSRILRNGHQQTLALTESDMYLKKNRGITSILQKATFDVDGNTIRVTQAVSGDTHFPVTFVYEDPTTLEPSYVIHAAQPSRLETAPPKKNTYQPSFKTSENTYFPPELAGLVRAQNDVLQKRFSVMPSYSSSRIAHIETQDQISGLRTP